MVYVTRKATFSAAHRLFNPSFSDQKNEAVFDKCNNPHGHGHNYVIEVTVKGHAISSTGYVVDLKELKRILDQQIIDLVDHKHLNHDVEFLSGLNPTVENLCVAFWQRLTDHLPNGELHSIKVWESEANAAEYFGEPTILHYWSKTGEINSVEVGVESVVAP